MTPCAVRGARLLLHSIDLWRRVRRHGLDRLACGKLLEIGPGDCSFLGWMSRRGWDVTGLDPDALVVRRGVQAGYRMIEGTVPMLSGEKYDVIVASHSFEHTVDPARGLAILAGSLAEGGKLVIGVPDYGSAMAAYFGPFWFDLEIPRHRAHFTIERLRLLLGGAGLKIERIRHWLSGGGTISPLVTALAMSTWPLCWALELLGAGDSLSVVAQRSS